VTSFVQQLHDQDLVLVVLGDHQPASIVRGEAVSHDVPVSIIAADPAVMDRAADWCWQEGLRPDAGTPVWPMDAFRDRFLTAYGPRRPRCRPRRITKRVRDGGPVNRRCAAGSPVPVAARISCAATHVEEPVAVPRAGGGYQGRSGQVR